MHLHHTHPRPPTHDLFFHLHPTTSKRRDLPTSDDGNGVRNVHVPGGGWGRLGLLGLGDHRPQPATEAQSRFRHAPWRRKGKRVEKGRGWKWDVEKFGPGVVEKGQYRHRYA